jgi:signal transduction histidine kinase
MSAMEQKRPSALTSLSARLLVLTMFFIMLSEFLIYAPSVARYRKVYLEEHIAKAHLATLALDATPDNMVSPELEKELLLHADAYGITLKHPDRRVLMLSDDMPPKVDVTFDLRTGNFMMWLKDAFAVLFSEEEGRFMRVVGVSPKDMRVLVEVVLLEAPMRQKMLEYSGRILQLSLVISLVAGLLVYLSLQWLTVRPMRRITDSMTAFHEDPEDESRTIVPSERSDEVGFAQRELAVMQNELRGALHQKTRLATLGAAVAKVNHDLRNSLATAILISDRLADIDDPEVKRMTPRLYSAIDRAVNLCSQTLNYVADGVPKLKRSQLRLRELVDEVAVSLAEADFGTDNPDIQWDNAVPADLDLDGDRDQLFRVVFNLAENACYAGASRVRIEAKPGDPFTVTVSDDGPGLPARARENLFQPFAGSARSGGTGLGLVIARDILRAHGGDIVLVETGDDGTTFRLHLPDVEREQ